MIEIRRFDLASIAEKKGLLTLADGFVFKPQNPSSTLYDKPHRSDMYSISLILSGKIKLSMGLETKTATAPALVAIAPDQIRQWELTEPPIIGTVLFFKEDFILSEMADSLFLRKLSVYSSIRNNLTLLSAKNLSKLENLYSLIQERMLSNDFNKQTIIRHLTRIILLEVDQIIKADFEKKDITRKFVLSEKFSTLLSAHFIRERKISFYAQNLNVTAKHLSQTLKELHGKTAGKMIGEMVCLEAKVLLQNREITITQITDYLNFSNPSFFGKFFKRETGMTPKQYRKLNL